MKTLKKVTALMLVFFAALIYSSCGKPDGGTSDTYIPDLATPPSQWQNLAEPTNNFFFFSAPPAGTASGTFEANSNGGANPGHVKGKFDHSTIEFTYDIGNYNGRTFSGKINGTVSPATMSVTAPASGAKPAVTLNLKKV